MGRLTLLDGIEGSELQRNKTLASSSRLEYGILGSRRGEFLLGKEGQGA